MTIKTFYALDNVNFYRDGTYENIIRGLRTKGSMHWRGYYSMVFSGIWKEVHRMIAEGFVHNYAPKKLKIVDHIRGDGNNSADNLRYVNRKLNAINNKCLGVCFDRNGSWRATFQMKHLGVFKNSRDAIRAVQKAKRIAFASEWNRVTGQTTKPEDHIMAFDFPPFSTSVKSVARGLKNNPENTKLGPFK